MRILLNGIAKNLNGLDLFNNFSLEITDGMRLCIAGHNGVGKSVLMRMIAQKEDVDAGEVILPKDAYIGYAQQEILDTDLSLSLLDFVFSAIPNWQELWNTWEEASKEADQKALALLTEEQNILESRFGYTPEQYCKHVLFGLGFKEEDLQKPLEALSGGFRERAKLARVLTAGSDILLLDEPINHLDIEAIEWLEKFLMQFKGIVVFIAHDRVFMDTVSTHTLYLGTKKPFFRKGSYTTLLEQLDSIEEQKQQAKELLHKEIEEKQAFINRFKAKPTKARQANSRKKAVTKLEKELATIELEKKHTPLSFRFPTPQKADKILVTLDNISKSYDTVLWKNLSTSIYNDAKIAIIGPNGIGKSTLLKCIVGGVQSDTGTVIQGSSLSIGYFSQHQSEILDFSNTVLAEIRRLAAPYTDDTTLMGVLGRFCLGQPYFERKVAALSGGEKNRLILASLFLAKHNLLILDEPTNHLDLETREALTKTLQEYKGAILFVAHDRYLLKHVAKEFLLPTHEGFVTFHSYEEYLNFKNQEKKTTTEKKESKNERKKQKQDEALARKARYELRKPKEQAYAQIEQQLTDLYTQIHTLEMELATPEVCKDSAVLQEKLKMLHLLKQEAESCMEQLIQLDEELAVL